MNSKFRSSFGKKVNFLLLLATILLFSFSIIVFASTENAFNNTAASQNDTERIEILIDNTELGYVPELAGLEYYYADVKHFLADSTADILDPASVMWTINDTSVAEILDNGAIIPKSEGVAVVTAEYQGLKDDIDIIVRKGVIKKFEITEKDLSLSNVVYNEKNKIPYELHALVKTSYGKMYEVTYTDDIEWMSDDSSIVSVKQGLLTMHGSGNTKISATFQGMKSSTNIKIKDNKVDSKKIKINKEQVVIEDANGTAKIKIEAQLDDSSILDITKIATWESENPSIAVAYDGRIDAISEGETVINVTFIDYHKSIKVIVKNSDDKKQVEHSMP